MKKNQKGGLCRSDVKQNRRKLLGGVILASLLLGGFAAPAYAAEPAEETKPDIQFHGFADGNGDPDLNTDPNFDKNKPLIPESDIHGIDVTLNHSNNFAESNPDGYGTDTTSALTFTENKTYKIDGKVDIVNTVMHEQIGNNDAIYAMGGANVSIVSAGSEDHIYLASIAKGEKDITPVTKETIQSVLQTYVNENMDLVWKALLGDNAAMETFKAGAKDKIKGAMQNGSSVLAAKDPLRTGESHENTITVSGDHVQLIGNLDFLGTGTNTINAKLNTANSFWYGDESNVPEEIIIDILNIKEINVNDLAGIHSGTLNVKLSNGAEWIYNANPSISALTLDGGIVNLQDDDIKSKYNTTIKGTNYTLSNYRSNAPHTYVDIGTLSGSGIFKVDLAYQPVLQPRLVNTYAEEGKKDVGTDSDYIHIAKSEFGTTQTLSFDASKANLEKMGANDKLYFATVSDGNTGFQTEHSVYSNAANVFNYHYEAAHEKTPSVKALSLTRADGSNASQDWFIKVTGKTAEDNANFTAARALMDAGYAMGTELDTLNKRMGEARYLDDDQGLWVRYRHGRSSRDNSYETDSNMIQLGYDRKNDAESGTHHRGVAFDYTDADTSLYQLSGSGDVERYALSLYDTWMGNKGHYYDFVIRGGRLNSGYDIDGWFSTGREAMDNSYHQWFGSVSFEYGRKKDMSGSWYIEPQAQLQLARIGGASFTSASGVRTDMDGMTSLIGRAGFRLGRDFGNDENGRDTFYVKADILHEFAGDRGFTLTGNDGWYTRNDNGTDTWYDVGIGADLSLGRNTYFWADVERILGSDFDNTWQVSGGLRWEW